MKSLHYDQCFIYFDHYMLYIYIYWHIDVCAYIYTYTYTYKCIYSLFHRDETKPTHIIGINSFLFFMQLIYKHSSPNYQHMTNHWKLINNMLVYLHWCVSWIVFNRIHVFAICDVVYMQFIRVHVIAILIYRWSLVSLTKQLRQTFLHHIQATSQHC